MKRVAWVVVALVLIGGAFTAKEIYPTQKWWMRAGYVWLWDTTNRITGNDFPTPDRFK